ncbi:MAG: hypothetical protein E7309_04975 [Butyrivibrio sp.]|jgi:hypothetical protein|uniref:Uncharacterized protein n=1 Tax=Butyrivibrio fibrisolvens TaxID=831 RepID=A0A1H9XAF5_BUTFI|nr:hypothetical protein [Butyrivibrio fibrisolvens]MBE5833969.1 hypothetical protein [Butyrivibrio sp.]SES43176.1 hypothetical protein SAMN04487884_1527 [Butyrivibrio fibrisolvens]
MINAIHPLFPNQASITTAVSALSDADKAKYTALMEAYKIEISADHINHDRVAVIIREAQELIAPSE